jgi:hypothetical protein
MGVLPGLGDIAGVSVAGGVGDDFFFFRGEALGDAVAETFSLDGVTDGVGDRFAGGEEDFFFAEGVGEGDGLFVECFFFRGVGVGVGVEKIFLSVLVKDCSAACAGAMAKAATAKTRRIRIMIATSLTVCSAIS